MNYKEALNYLETFVDYEKLSSHTYSRSFNIERIKSFLESFGSPHRGLKAVHVAGTKGKGSVCVFCSYILRNAGYRVGLYTSPHLHSFRERIRVLEPKAGRRRNAVFEGMISSRDFGGLVEELKPSIEKFNAASKRGRLTFFEIYTAIAFVYFRRKKVDFAVLETGIGGRLDATNVVNALVCAITPLSYEHTHLLGKTLRAIAAEKAGIIKVPRRDVISAPQKKEAMDVIRARCRQVGAGLYKVGRDITYKKIKNTFDVKGRFGIYKNLRIRLLGEHQIANAAVAVGIIDALAGCGAKAGIVPIRKGLYETSWPGRCEVIGRGPFVVLDGAQNEVSASVLIKAVKDNFRYKKLILVLGVSKDKDIKGICRRLCPSADKIILTRADNPRAAEAEDIYNLLGRTSAAGIVKTETVKEAKKAAFRTAKKNDLILVAGSLFVAGEFR